MITESCALYWSHARAASHSVSQSLDIDFEPDDAAPIAPEINELVLVRSVGQGHRNVARFETSLSGSHAPYSAPSELASLMIWALWTPHHAGVPFTEAGLETAAFHELDALRSDDYPALQAIRRLGTMQLSYRDRLAARLEELLRVYQEDYGGRSLSPSAIDALVTFLSMHPYLRRPRVSATPSGDLYAEWTSPPDTLFGVRFMRSGEVQYVVFTPNTLHEGRTDRASGITTADALMEKLSHLRDQRWLTNEG